MTDSGKNLITLGVKMNMNRNLERHVPGCLGRKMVNLFDLNTHVGGNKLLTEKPHYEGSPVFRSLSDMPTSCVVDDHMQMVSELGRSPSNRKLNGTPIKMLIAQEMSKEEVSKKGPPSLVAKLMGLDDIPGHGPLSSPSCRTNLTSSRSLEFIQKDHNGKCKESINEKNMALIREKFMEAKRLSTDEKLRQSKQFQDALEVLNSNKDLFLKYLQEPNSLFSQHHNLPSIPPRPDSKRITILKPSNFVDNHMLPQDKFSENHHQPTRIVVLKPKGGNVNETRPVSSSPSSKTLNDDGFYADLEDNESEESSSSHRDETLVSSVLSNGYNGDESSFGKSEVYYAAGNLSDSEVMSVSPTSRYSWDYDHDYIDRFGSPYSSSSFSRMSCSLESSVCREAKKRLSERWAMLSLNRSGQEQSQVRRNSSTLGEMLSLFDCKNISDFNKNKGHDVEADGIPENLVRSKPLSVSSTEFLKGKKDDDTKDLTMEKSQKSSLFKGNVSRLFFSRSQKSNKQKSQMFDDEVHQSSGNIGNECINDIVVKDIGQRSTEGSVNANENADQPSPISVLESQLKDDDHTSSCSSTSKLNKIGIDPNIYNLIDKSPPIGSISRTLALDHYAAGPVTPVLGKTSTKPLSREKEERECFVYVQALLSAAGNSNEVQSDSVTTRWQWHSPESPLDPSLRDNYMSLTNKEPVHQSKERHQRSFQRLVFDCVNEVLTSGTKLTMDRVWGQMKEWISGEEMCDWDDDGGGAVVERVVRKEVESEVWMEDLRLENEDVKHEIEVKLVEQFVDDFVVELIDGVNLAYTH